MNIAKSFGLGLAFLFIASQSFGQAALKRANKQYELGTFNLAAQSYKEFLAKNTDNGEANSKLADCYRHLNQQEKALPYYQAAIASGEVQDIYIFQYGLTLQELGRYDLAKGVFNKLGEKSDEFKVRCKQFAEACEFASKSDAAEPYKVSNEFANTASFDFGPAFFGEQLVYSSGRSDIRAKDSRNAPSGGSEGTNRLFITQRDKNGFLEVPTTLHTGFGASVNEGPASYTTDGQWVAFTRNNFIDGTRMMPSSGLEMNLFIAQAKNDGDWDNAIAFPHNGTDFSTGYPSFSPDGKALYFASNKPGGYGGFDLYVSFKIGDNWSAPENLGGVVNSLGNEITPFFDGNTLHFASDYHKGFGGFDVFRAEENGGRWSTVYHGGPGLNSSYDDYGYVFNTTRNIGYFVSNRPGGKGSEDIYRIVKEVESAVIKVADALTGTAIAGATIDFSNCGSGNQLTNVNGLFNFTINDDLNCTATVSKDGFSSKTIKLNAASLRQSRTVEVELNNNANAYSGKVVLPNSGKAVEGVTVSATNTANETETTATTGADGTFSISLKPNATYVIRYSKPGYKDTTVEFKATSSSQKNLDIASITLVGSTAGTKPGAKTQAEPIDPTPTSFEQPSSTTNSKEVTIDGFSVQLASGTTAKPDLKPYQDKLGKLGNVYAVNDGGKTKIRLGVFETRDAAAAAQLKAKEVGYNGAFIVTETGKPSAASPSKKEAPKASTVSEEPKQKQEKPASTQPKSVDSNVSEMDGYLVKLAAYKDLKNFNRSKVEEIGLVGILKKGDFNIVVLSGFESKAAAAKALDAAKKQGFTTAHLVTMEKGELKKAE
ncbi:MAG: carboxypeptidase regulatory-like domain-containing protein [Saprospiraceae bacterium]|nr:carboxypeptidase regulatory-like domain-containing protein [Saprospiraceae bacterium]